MRSSKWPVFIRSPVAGFDRSLTAPQKQRQRLKLQKIPFSWRRQLRRNHLSTFFSHQVPMMIRPLPDTGRSGSTAAGRELESRPAARFTSNPPAELRKIINSK